MPPPQTPPKAVTNARLIAWAFERLNERDLDSMRHLWSAETVERFPDGSYRGGDAIAAYLADAMAAMPDWHMDVITIAEQDDDVFVHWQLTGTHSGGPFQGIEPTGKKIALDGMDHFVLSDGVVASNFVVYDQMQFARAIGMLPPDGSRADRAVKRAFNARSRLAGRLRRI